MYQSKMKSEETDHLFKAILSLRTEEECYRFFDDLCTFSEIEAMSQRFEVASLLADGKTSHEMHETFRALHQQIRCNADEQAAQAVLELAQ